MTKERDRLPTFSRREFIVQLAALAGLLPGCSPSGQSATPTRQTTAPTPMPTGVSAVAATTAPTVVSAAHPTPARPAIIQFHPDAPSKVVRARHAGVWDGETLVPGAIRQMLDAAITQLTGLNDAQAAWTALFDPGERIAIKVNTLSLSRYWTHAPLVLAVTERLQEAGVPAEQIVIFDMRTGELPSAGYSTNRDGPGVRCTGTDGKYTAGWKVMDTDVGLSDILLSCDALINVPVLKQHQWSGISFAMKNHYGSFNKPSSFHGDRVVRGIAELNALPPIRERARLVVGDALIVIQQGWQQAVPGDSIFMSFDPVAHDTAGLQLYSEVLASEGGSPTSAEKQASAWLESGAQLGLGTNDPAHMELVEVSLG